MSTKQPSARIAVNKNVVPAGTNVYLKSGQEFEIELFNPTKENVLAKIYINGESISNSGIIIRPGRREWIERYIDKAKKFKFDVYEVESNDSDVKAAIKDNGSIKVEFYKEKPKANNQLILGNWNGFNQPVQPIQPYNPWGQPYQPYQPYPYIYGTCNNIGSPLSGNITFTNNQDNTSFLNVSSSDVTCNNNMYFSNTSFGLSAEQEWSNGEVKCSLNEDAVNNLKRSFSKTTKEETGRIEEGSVSNQTFTEVEMDFETWVLSSIEYKLLPVSKKPVDISSIKVYCVECGAAKKKSAHKFCPHCGTKFE
jgi:hypothetical protein